MFDSYYLFGFLQNFKRVNAPIKPYMVLIEDNLLYHIKK